MLRGSLCPDLENAQPNGKAEDLAAVMKHVLAGSQLAVDNETATGARSRCLTGKEPTQARMKNIAIGTTEGGVSVYWSNLFFFNDTATTEIYTLSLHDALPI